MGSVGAPSHSDAGASDSDLALLHVHMRDLSGLHTSGGSTGSSRSGRFSEEVSQPRLRETTGRSTEMKRRALGGTMTAQWEMLPALAQADGSCRWRIIRLQQRQRQQTQQQTWRRTRGALMWSTL